MAPKNLLRHKECKSNLSEFDDVQGHPGFDKQGTRFKRLIKDQNHHSDLEEGIRRFILCSGKVCFSCIHPIQYIYIPSIIQWVLVFMLKKLHALHYKLDCIYRYTMNLMKRGRNLMAKMLLYVVWNNFVRSHMISSSVN